MPSIFDQAFMPHAYCYLCQPGLLWLHLLADSITGLVCYSVPILLRWFVRNRSNIQFDQSIFLFSALGLIYGTNHFLEILTLWYPIYWLVGILKVVTAIVSVYAAVELVAIMPQLLVLPSLRITNENLQQEIAERQRVEAALRDSEELNRTTELSKLNQQLAIELQERRRTQEALQVSQEQLKEALQKLNFHVENSPLAVIQWNRDFKVIRWSGAAEKIFGWSVNDVLDKHLGEWQFVFIEDVEKIRLEAAGLMNGTKQRSICHNRNYHKDGSIVNCEWYNSALLDENGEMESVLSLALDVTDRDRVERMKNEFVSIVSHELRTPLTSIHGSLGLLASGLIDPQSDKAKRLIQIAAHSTERLIRMINDILDLERIESGKIQLVSEVWTVSDLIYTAINTVQPLAEKADVSISVSTISECIRVDPDRIVRALTNLLSNAIKFSSPGYSIDCTIEREAHDLIFRIRDRGRGIPADKLEAIFERFQQVDSSDSRNHEGTGLGLAISRTIIQQHSGQIWAESVIGEGSTFCFKLPALD